jgi:hypothetical protein
VNVQLLIDFNHYSDTGRSLIIRMTGRIYVVMEKTGELAEIAYKESYRPDFHVFNFELHWDLLNQESKDWYVANMV